MFEQNKALKSVLVCIIELLYLAFVFAEELRCVAAGSARALVYCCTSQCAELTATHTATSACSTASKSRHVGYY